MTDTPDPDDVTGLAFEELIERSTFSTPEAKALRAQTPDDVSDEILLRAYAPSAEILCIARRRLADVIAERTGLTHDGAARFADELLAVIWPDDEDDQ